MTGVYSITLSKKDGNFIFTKTSNGKTFIGRVIFSDRNKNNILDDTDSLSGITGKISVEDFNKISSEFSMYFSKCEDGKKLKFSIPNENIKVDKSGNIINLNGKGCKLGLLFDKYFALKNPIAQIKFSKEEEATIAYISKHYKGKVRYDYPNFSGQSVKSKDIKEIIRMTMEKAHCSKEEALKFIEKEGLMRWVYNDAYGKPTCAVGHALNNSMAKKYLEKEKNPDYEGLSNQQIADYLASDLETAKKRLINAVGDEALVDSLTPGQRYALVDLSFNVGNLSKSELIQYLKNKNFIEVIKSYDFVGQKGHELQGLCRRRIEALEDLVEGRPDAEKKAALEQVEKLKTIGLERSKDNRRKISAEIKKIKNSQLFKKIQLGLRILKSNVVDAKFTSIANETSRKIKLSIEK